MQLYSGPLSLFTAKVRVALAEKGLAYELVSVPFSRARGYEPKHPEVLARNPKAQVPVLVDGGVSLYDSTIILEYLEDRYPEPRLYPQEPGARGRCRQLEAAADEVLFPFVWELIQEVFYKPDPVTRDAARVTTATEGIRRCHARLDEELAGRAYLCDAFSVADIGFFLTIGFATSLGVPPGPEHAELGRWQAGVGGRPSIEAEWRTMMAAAAQAAA